MNSTSTIQTHYSSSTNITTVGADIIPTCSLNTSQLQKRRNLFSNSISFPLSYISRQKEESDSLSFFIQQDPLNQKPQWRRGTLNIHLRRTDIEKKITRIWGIETCLRAYVEDIVYTTFNSTQTNPFPLEYLSLIDT